MFLNSRQKIPKCITATLPQLQSAFNFFKNVALFLHPLQIRKHISEGFITFILKFPDKDKHMPNSICLSIQSNSILVCNTPVLFLFNAHRPN